MTKHLHEDGFGLPLALLVLLIIGGSTGILFSLSASGMHSSKTHRTADEVFAAAESALNLGIREVVSNPNFWAVRTPLTPTPLNYTAYSPAAESATDGIPSCAGRGCERNFYPIGGGLLKNYGPLDTDGSAVEASVSIVDQLEALEPAADFTINGMPAWFQIERLDESEISSEAVGVNLDPSSMKLQVRFRITGAARRTLRGVEGVTTIVALVAVTPV